MTSEKFFALTPPPAESQKCVSRERKLGSEHGFQIWIADDVIIQKMTSEKFLASTPPGREQKMFISGMEARIGQRFSILYVV